MIIKFYSGIEVKCNEEDLNKQNVIYCLTFENGKTYVGQTINKLYRRINQHCGEKHSNCTKLKNAIQKYKSFTVSILSSNLDINQMNLFEQMFIKMLNSNGVDGYNLDSGGKNYYKSEETLNRMKLAQSNMSDETKRKISESNIGKCFSEEHKKNLSISHKGLKNNLGTKYTTDSKRLIGLKHMKKIKSIPDNIVFDSIKECATHYKISKCHLSKYYNGKYHRRSGQTFVLL